MKKLKCRVCKAELSGIFGDVCKANGQDQICADCSCGLECFNNDASVLKAAIKYLKEEEEVPDNG